MLAEFKDWVESMLADRYSYTLGQWVESAQDKRYCVIQPAGGMAPNVEDRRPRFRVLLIGGRNKRQDAMSLIADASILIDETLNNSAPCRVAGIKALGEVIGPGYTSENRAWVQVDFELVY